MECTETLDERRREKGIVETVGSAEISDQLNSGNETIRRPI